VEVFHHHEHRLLLGQCPHQGQEHVEGALPLLFGWQRPGRIAPGRQRQRDELGHQGHCLVQGQRCLRQEGLQLRERRAGGLARVPLEPALEELDNGVPGGVLVIG
jgi:hypothetical protein